MKEEKIHTVTVDQTVKQSDINTDISTDRKIEIKTDKNFVRKTQRLTRKQKDT